MIYALVHYPNIDDPCIDQFRKKYDPQAELIAPHITVMFPVPASVGEDNLIQHLASILCSWQSFLVHLQGIHISSDDHLFLMLQEGNANLACLHDEIYTGLLAEYRREDICFVPHVTLGVIRRDLDNHSSVLEEAIELGIDYRCMLDKLQLVKVNDDRSRIIWSKEFALAE